MLFCERSQQIFELNSTADCIWSGLSAGNTPRRVAGDLEALGAPENSAREYVIDIILQLLGLGHLLPIDLARPRFRQAGKQFALQIGGFACRLQLHVPDDDLLIDQFVETFHQFFAPVVAACGEVAVIARSGSYFVSLNGSPIGMFSRECVIPEIKARVTEGLATSTRGDSFLLHAALLASEERGLLISGPAGAGKSTLALALAAKGFGYGSDDVVEVHNGCSFKGVRFAPASKADGWHLIEPYVADIQRLPTHVRHDSRSVRYIPVNGFRCGDVMALRWVILLDRRPATTAVLQPVEPLEALSQLLAAAFSGERRIEADTLAAFGAALCRARCFQLVYSDLPSALTALDEMVHA
jgi:hypothetical protein